jgi:hypothetical protein
MQGFDFATVGRNWGANQGYPTGINGDIAHDAFQGKSQKFMPSLNQSYGLSTNERDLATNQGYPIGISGAPREENSNQSMYTLFHNSQQFVSPLNQHQKLEFPSTRHDLGANYGYLGGNRGAMIDEKRNQRVVHDASGVLNNMLQREREVRKHQAPVYTSLPDMHSANQFPPFIRHQSSDSHGTGMMPMEREKSKNEKSNPHPAVSPFSVEDIVKVHKFHITSKKTEVGFAGSHSSEISLVTSSSEEFKDEEGEEDLSEQLMESLLISENGDLNNAVVAVKKSSRNKVK